MLDRLELHRVFIHTEARRLLPMLQAAGFVSWRNERKLTMMTPAKMLGTIPDASHRERKLLSEIIEASLD